MENKEKIKYLSLSWFKSKIETAVENATERIISKKIESLVEELSNTEVDEDEIKSEQSPQLSIAFEKPYATSVEVNGTLTVVLRDGRVLVKKGVTHIDLDKTRTEADVIKLMSDETVLREIEAKEKVRKEIELVKNNFDILVETGDFEVREDSVYLKGINRSIPKLLVNKFAEICEEYKEDAYGTDAHFSQFLDEDIRYQSLIRFWKKCCLNPNAQSAEDLYAFLEKHNMKIDQHGNFYAYRRVQTVDTGTSKQLVDFISNAYNKIKSIWKKAPKSFKVVTIPDSNVFELKPFSFNLENTDYVCLGDLESLYLNLPNMKENRYTSAHTGKEDYRVGNVISMPRNEGDDNNKQSCSMGFHASSKEYDYSGFGDQDILVIINPADVLAVPVGEVGKLRTCRWYFAMTLDEGERFILDEDCFDVTYLGDIFEEKCLEDLEEHVKRGFTEEVKRHTFSLPSIGHKEIKAICKDLSSIKSELAERVVKV